MFSMQFYCFSICIISLLLVCKGENNRQSKDYNIDVLIRKSRDTGLNDVSGIPSEDLELSKTRAFESIDNNRDDQWGWEAGQTPRVVLAMQLSDPNWASKENLETQLSLQRMDIELLTFLSHGKKPPKINKNSDEAAFQVPIITPGNLAIYINALISTCRDPTNFYGHDLKKMLKKSMRKFPIEDFSNHFQYSLAVLALCGSQSKIEEQFVRELLEVQKSNDGSFDHNIDITAMSVMALVCASDRSKIPLSESISKSVNYLISKQNEDGSIGNIHSTVKAIQALIVSGVELSSWKYEEAFRFVLNSQLADGSFGARVVATTQALPALSFRSIDPWKIECPKYNCSSDETLQSQTTPTINIFLEVDNGELNASSDGFSANFEVPLNSTLYEAMEIASRKFDNFSFESRESAWGSYITAINGIRANSVERTYWSILKDEKPSETGASTLVLQNGDKIKYKLRNW